MWWLGLASVVTGDPGTLALSKVSTMGAACLDGSPAAYYFAPSPNGRSEWVFYLQGGGACEDETQCSERARTHLGSSTNYTATVAGEMIYSGDETANPDFHDSNRVYVPYCSGDTHRGTRTAASAETFGLHFSGHVNLAAIVAHLRQNRGLGEAKRILLSGGSAGGVGALFNADWLTAEMGPSVSVKAAPIGGFFFPGHTRDHPLLPASPPSDWSDFLAHRATVWNSSVSELWRPIPAYGPHNTTSRCAAKYGWLCTNAGVYYPFAETPMLLLQNRFDTNQLEEQLGMPRGEQRSPEGQAFVSYFGDAMLNSTLPFVKPGDGLFLASCFDHTQGIMIGTNTNTRINGTTTTEMLGNWYNGRPGKRVLVDTCGHLPCNPTCAGAGPSPPTECSSALKHLCPKLLNPSPGACGRCAERHRPELTKAGCTEAAVKTICQQRGA